MARDMAQDPDLIARVYPEDPAGHSKEIILKHPWCITREREPQLHSRTSRESTVEYQDGDELEDLPYLELRFSHLPRSSSGFVFGTNKATCDVVLPGWPGISRNHFALTYKNTFRDGNYRLIVRDLGSTSGTLVTYDRRGGQRRSQFDWTVSGFAVAASAQTIIIEPHKGVRFRLVVTHHNLRSPAYISNVERFRGGAAAAEDLLGVLGFHNGLETGRATGTHTPLEIPLLIKLDLIDQGASKGVSRYWNVSNGEEYACKHPVGKDHDKRAWEKQINIMKQVSHGNIVRLCSSQLAPEPRLYLEYMSFGNVEDVHRSRPFSHNECWSILRQSLSALSYLHSRPEPLVHQGINPRNILVRHRDTDSNHSSLRVKLSDFGFPRAAGLRSIAAATYLAPEALENGAPREHTTAADIWSLGLVVLRLAYGLPAPGRGWDVRWCNKIVKELKTWDSDDLTVILRRMLVIDPKERSSASTCLHAVSQLNDVAGRRSAASAGVASAAKEKAREILPHQQHPAVQPPRQPFQHLVAQPPRQPLQHPAVQPPRQPLQHLAAQPPRQPLQPLAAQPPRQPLQHPAVQPPRQPLQPPTVQPSQPPGQPSQSVLPSPVDPGVALPETLTVRPLPSGGFKVVERRDGSAVAVYDPHPLGKIKLTSLLAGMGHPKKRQGYYIGCVPPSKKTVVKQGQQIRLGTWVSFDYALELADKWNWPSYVKTAVVMAKEDSQGS